MAPTPTLPKLPALHLRVLDLSHEGSDRFFSHTSSPYSLLSTSSLNVLSSLYPSSLPSSASPPSIRSITLHLRLFSGVAYTTSSNLDTEHKEIHLSLSYLSSIDGDSKRIKQEIEGVVLHELVHVFQWDGEGKGEGGEGRMPGGVIEGVADWVRLKKGLGPPHWREGGEEWDGGYQTTAYFLEWLSKRFNDELFVPKLNLAMRDVGWEDGKTLKKLLKGEDVDELWKVYKKDLEKKEEAEKEEDPPKPVPTHGYGVKYAE